MVKHFSIFARYIAVGEVDTVVLADVAIAGTREGGEVANVGGCVAGNIADAVAFWGDYGDGLRVVGVGGFGLQGGNKLSEVFVDVLTVGDACNRELKVVAYALVFRPDAYVTAFVTEAEVIETLDYRHCGLCL